MLCDQLFNVDTCPRGKRIKSWGGGGGGGYVWYDTVGNDNVLGGGRAFAPLGLNPVFCSEAPCSADIQVQLLVLVTTNMCVEMAVVGCGGYLSPFNL